MSLGGSSQPSFQLSINEGLTFPTPMHAGSSNVANDTAPVCICNVRSIGKSDRFRKIRQSCDICKVFWYTYLSGRRHTVCYTKAIVLSKLEKRRTTSQFCSSLLHFRWRIYLRLKMSGQGDDIDLFSGRGLSFASNACSWRCLSMSEQRLAALPKIPQDG